MSSDSNTSNAMNCDIYRKSILIVGAGYGGLRFFAESLHELINSNIQDLFEYIIIDSRTRDQYGRGVAWASDQNPHMRTNMHIPEITADPTTGRTVAEILGVSYDRQPTESELFSKRVVVGKIFSDQFNQTIELAERHSIPVHCIEDEVTDLERVGIKYRASLKSDRTIHADHVVLALGHIPPTTYPHLFHHINYIRNPWARTDEIGKIPRSAKVAVLGLGPTAVDTIIRLRDGNVNDINAYSRSGTMQYPRPKPTRFMPKIFNEANLKKTAEDFGPLRIGVIKGMIFSEFLIQSVDWRPLISTLNISKQAPVESFRHGYARCNVAADWFGLVTALTAALPTAWHLLDDRDRDRFRSIHREFSNIIYGMAPSHALRMLAEIDERSLSVLGGLESVEKSEGSKTFTVSGQDQGAQFRHEVEYVIDCTGFGVNITLSETPLIVNMLRRKYIKPYRFGGAVVDFDSGQLAPLDSGKSLQVYCLAGSLTIGSRFVTNGLGEVHRSAQRTARAIHARLG